MRHAASQSILLLAIQLTKTKRLHDATNRIVWEKKLTVNAKWPNDHSEIEVCTVVFLSCSWWKRARAISFKMKRSIITILLGILFVISVLSKPADADGESSREEEESNVVETDSGRVRGRKNYTLFGSKAFYAFKGIPYARAPVKELRFKVNYYIQHPYCGAIVITFASNCSHHGNRCPGRIFTMPLSSVTNAFNGVQISRIQFAATKIAFFWMYTLLLRHCRQRKTQLCRQLCSRLRKWIWTRFFAGTKCYFGT